MATNTPRLLAGLVLLALAAPFPALAGTLVLSPLLADEGVDGRDRLAMHQIIASELDFAPQIGAVAALEVRPPTLDAACLDSVKCLSRIAQANGGDRLLAGRMRRHPDGFELDLVLLDGSTLRKQHAIVPRDATQLATAITPVVQALLGGEKKPAPPPAPVVAAAPVAPAPLVQASAPAVEAPPPVVVAPAAAAVAAAAPAAASDADVAELIQFGGSPDDISAQEINELIQFAPPPEVVAVEATEPESSAGRAPRLAAEPESSAGRAPRLAAEPVATTAVVTAAAAAAATDGIPAAMAGPVAVVPVEEKPGREPRVAQEKPPKEPPPPKQPKPVKEARAVSSDTVATAQPFQITGRAGYSRYYTFDFTTAGAELGAKLVGGLRAIGGVEMYAVNRELTQEEQIETGLASEWNFIFPFNVGLVYELKFGIVEPYGGADMIVVQYYKDDIGADWAAGARMRAGMDLMVAQNVGINVNLAAGFWTGQNWIYIQEGLRETGFLPQVSGGMVVAF